MNSQQRREKILEMHDASQTGDIEQIKKLIEQGISVNDRFHPDFYAFREAASFGHSEIVKLFLEHGADIHDWDDWALISASERGHYDTVSVLLEHGANVHARDDKAYREAVSRGREDIAKLLLAYGADEHAEDPDAGLYEDDA